MCVCVCVRMHVYVRTCECSFARCKSDPTLKYVCIGLIVIFFQNRVSVLIIFFLNLDINS